MALTRAAIEAAQDLKRDTMSAPAWADESGDDVLHLREMTADHRQRYGELFIALRKAGNGTVDRLPQHYHAVICCMGLCDEAGELLFDHDNPNDVALLAGKGQTTIEVSNRVLHLSGLDSVGEENAEKK